jgi:hypothetical protein
VRDSNFRVFQIWCEALAAALSAMAAVLR